MSLENVRKKARYIERPEVAEIYADVVGNASFDQLHYRMEFCITRLDEPKPPEPPKARKYPACRLVLPLSAMIELHKNLQNMLVALAAQGVVKFEGPVPPVNPTVN